MPTTTPIPDVTIEEQLRAAQGVLLLIAEIFELHSLTPDGSGPGFSAAAAATVAALCRRHGDDLDRLVSSLPAATANAAAHPTRGPGHDRRTVPGRLKRLTGRSRERCHRDEAASSHFPHPEG